MWKWKKMCAWLQGHCQEHPDLLNWWRQGNHRRGSTSPWVVTFRFYFIPGMDWPEPKPAKSQTGTCSSITRAPRKTRAKLAKGKKGLRSNFIYHYTLWLRVPLQLSCRASLGTGSCSKVHQNPFLLQAEQTELSSELQPGLVRSHKGTLTLCVILPALPAPAGF